MLALASQRRAALHAAALQSTISKKKSLKTLCLLMDPRGCSGQAQHLSAPAVLNPGNLTSTKEVKNNLVTIEEISFTGLEEVFDPDTDVPAVAPPPPTQEVKLGTVSILSSFFLLVFKFHSSCFL